MIEPITLEKLNPRNKTRAMLVAGLLLTGACSDTPEPDPDPHRYERLSEGASSEWKITQVDDIGMTDFNPRQNAENHVYFVEYTDKSGATLICKETLEYDSENNTSDCNWGEYNQEKGRQ